MSLRVSFSPRDVLDETWDLIESVSEVFPTYFYKDYLIRTGGWSGGAMVLGKLPVPGRLSNLD